MKSKAGAAPASNMLNLSRPEAVPVSLIAATRNPCRRNPRIELRTVYVLPASIDVPQTPITLGAARRGESTGDKAWSDSLTGLPVSSPIAPMMRSLLGSDTLSCLLSTNPHNPPIDRRSHRSPSERAYASNWSVAYRLPKATTTRSPSCRVQRRPSTSSSVVFLPIFSSRASTTSPGEGLEGTASWVCSAARGTWRAMYATFMHALVSSGRRIVIQSVPVGGCAGRGTRDGDPRTVATQWLQLMRPGNVKTLLRIVRHVVDRRGRTQCIRQLLHFVAPSEVDRPSLRETIRHVETESIPAVTASIVVHVVGLFGFIVPQAEAVRKRGLDRLRRTDMEARSHILLDAGKIDRLYGAHAQIGGRAVAVEVPIEVG